MIDVMRPIAQKLLLEFRIKNWYGRKRKTPSWIIGAPIKVHQGSNFEDNDFILTYSAVKFLQL